MNKMTVAGSFFATVSCVICGYHVYKEAWSSNTGQDFVKLAEENVYNRKALVATCAEEYPVIPTSDDISGVITIVKYCFARCITHHS